MKPSIGTIIVIGALFGVLGFTCSARNSAVTADQTVKQSLADLDASYQRRSDLLPNLVKTVKAAGTFENSTFVELAKARASAGSIKLTADDLKDPAKVKAFEDAQAHLQSAMSRLLVVAENYPQLKATQGYMDLMSQIEGTENRIQKARHDVNEAVGDYNKMVLSFPASAIDNFFGFTEKQMLKAKAGAEDAPSIDFGDGGNK